MSRVRCPHCAHTKEERLSFLNVFYLFFRTVSTDRRVDVPHADGADVGGVVVGVVGFGADAASRLPRPEQLVGEEAALHVHAADGAAADVVRRGAPVGRRPAGAGRRRRRRRVVAAPRRRRPPDAARRRRRRWRRRRRRRHHDRRRIRLIPLAVHHGTLRSPG